VVSFVKESLGANIEASSLLSRVMIPAINDVGRRFDRKEYFLPQLVASAETMKKACDYLNPYLKRKDLSPGRRSVVIMATVKGDIHDIGKNIVSLILGNHGFKVLDLGKDVSPQKIIREIKKHNSLVVGLSALMTTTMVNMKKVVDLAKQNRLNCRFIVGGAVVTRSYARSIDAEYAADGVDAVKVIKKLSKGL